MLIVLLDTNIWVSALIKPQGFADKIVQAWRGGQFEVVTSLPVLEEIADVLMRPRIQRRYSITSDDIEELLHLLDERSVYVEPSGSVQICRDPDDDLILETAILGKATYIVSRDEDVMRDDAVRAFMEEHDVAVITLRQFGEILASGDLSNTTMM